MKIKLTLSILTSVCLVTIAAGAAPKEKSPNGWLPAGSNPGNYEMSVDRSVAHGGHASASVKCISEKVPGFGTLMQMFKADSYRGKRVKMTGYVRSKDVSDWSGLWMRVDGPVSQEARTPETLAFDNMQKRAIKGTGDWKQYEIVLDVAESAREIAFGILLNGPGRVWLDDVQFEVVDKSVPTTGDALSTIKTSPTEPVNLDFEN